MPVDYSKWDALELSDDSDIEVHPNVDHRSFVNAKRNQIHQQRAERKHRITTLKYERVVNDGLLSRIDALLASLEAHKVEMQGKTKDEVDEAIFDTLADVCTDGSHGADQLPAPPQGVHTQEPQQSYSKMLGVLVDQVKAEVDKSKEDRYSSYIKEVQSHKSQVAGLQKDLHVELARLEKEETSKITSESYHTGFSSSHVSKAEPKSTTTTTKTTTEPELLNPGAMTKTEDLDAAVDEDDMEASPTAKQFSRLGQNDFPASLAFISTHPEILSERETDGLLVEAFNAQSNAKTKKDEDHARHCVHQALLLQYCRQLGRDGVGLFFKRIQTPGHQARKLFLDDVNSTYARIRTRTAELAKVKDEEGDREQIQLHAVDPGTSINIITPAPFEQCTTDDERAAREIFESFTPDLQKALESGSLDRVNDVLGKMSVAEAEQVVEQLGDGGMLSLEGGVIDATTEEGRKQVEAIEQQRHVPAAEADAEPGLSVDEVD
ncbi:hypothetical protein AMS68_000394 [Peltaster fructicola]|uniref:Hsp90 chaperone protein kinase-targeting subunit n=1 Tax=Peltaster fructicola TaxID=286661 RepID=A0A6H0XJH2_9PEZI|nr:hypothetical protein AMS68_000394 [Peltaster fructicola]